MRKVIKKKGKFFWTELIEVSCCVPDCKQAPEFAYAESEGWAVKGPWCKDHKEDMETFNDVIL